MKFILGLLLSLEAICMISFILNPEILILGYNAFKLGGVFLVSLIALGGLWILID